MKLSNKTILITGGSSGFGLLFAKRLAELGNKIIITGRNIQKLQSIQHQYPSISVIKSDVSDTVQIRELVKSVVSLHPGLDMIINNAGEMKMINLNDNESDLETLTSEIKINLIGPIQMVKAFLPHLKSQKEPAILNITSGIALVPFPLSPVYGASKSGLRSFTQSMRVQLAHTNVKVYELIAPAARTPLGNKFLGVDGFDEKMLADPEKIVDAAIKGILKDRAEIYPGIAKLLRILSRIIPGGSIKTDR